MMEPAVERLSDKSLDGGFGFRRAQVGVEFFMKNLFRDDVWKKPKSIPETHLYNGKPLGGEFLKQLLLLSRA